MTSINPVPILTCTSASTSIAVTVNDPKIKVLLTDAWYVPGIHFFSRSFITNYESERTMSIVQTSAR